MSKSMRYAGSDALCLVFRRHLVMKIFNLEKKVSKLRWDSLEGVQIFIRNFPSSEYHFLKFGQNQFLLTCNPIGVSVITFCDIIRIPCIPRTFFISDTCYGFKINRIQSVETKTGPVVILIHSIA